MIIWQHINPKLTMMGSIQLAFYSFVKKFEVKKLVVYNLLRKITCDGLTLGPRMG